MKRLLFAFSLTILTAGVAQAQTDWLRPAPSYMGRPTYRDSQLRTYTKPSYLPSNTLERQDDGKQFYCTSSYCQEQ